MMVTKRDRSKHNELIKHGVTWVGKSFPYYLVEPRTNCTENPDIIAFMPCGTSVMIEVIASRQAFHNDKRKKFRVNPFEGMGHYRYYLCDEGVIEEGDIPDTWGLLHFSRGRVVMVRWSKGHSRSEFAYNAELSLLAKFIDEKCTIRATIE